MNLINSIRDLSIGTYVKGANAKHSVKSYGVSNPGIMLILMGIVMLLMPLGAYAGSGTDLAGVMGGWTETLKAIVKFVMNVAVVIGVLAIAYGVKLVIDKSNERENVKNGHIVVSFVGGAMMCMLWFVVQMMTNTVGDGELGDEGTW